MFLGLCVACRNQEIAVSEQDDSVNQPILNSEMIIEDSAEQLHPEEKSEETSEEMSFETEPESETVFDEISSEMSPDSFEVEVFEAELCANKTVNVRKGPSTDYEKVGVLDKGVSVKVIGKVSLGWYQIQYEDETAYVAQSFLVDKEVYQQENSSEQQNEVSEESESEEKSEASQVADGQAVRDRIVVLMNEQRAIAGIGGLTQSVALNNVAQIRAMEIVQAFSHTRPDGSSCFTVLSESGIAYMSAGENIAMGYLSAESVMDGWMNSEGHRANILNPVFGQVGIGVYETEDGGGYYWVQIFTN